MRDRINCLVIIIFNGTSSVCSASGFMVTFGRVPELDAQSRNSYSSDFRKYLQDDPRLSDQISNSDRKEMRIQARIKLMSAGVSCRGEHPVIGLAIGSLKRGSGFWV
jgi:hypothetical protein